MWSAYKEYTIFNNKTYPKKKNEQDDTRGE